MGEQTDPSLALRLTQTKGDEFKELMTSLTQNVSTRQIEQEKRDDAARMLIFEQEQQKKNEKNEQKLKQNGERILQKYEAFQIAAEKNRVDEAKKRKSENKMRYPVIRKNTRRVERGRRGRGNRSVVEAKIPRSLTKKSGNIPPTYSKGLANSIRKLSLEQLLELPYTQKDRTFQKWANQNYKRDKGSKEIVVDWIIAENTRNPVAIAARKRREQRALQRAAFRH